MPKRSNIHATAEEKIQWEATKKFGKKTELDSFQRREQKFMSLLDSFYQQHAPSLTKLYQPDRRIAIELCSWAGDRFDGFNHKTKGGRFSIDAMKRWLHQRRGDHSPVAMYFVQRLTAEIAFMKEHGVRLTEDDIAQMARALCQCSLKPASKHAAGQEIPLLIRRRMTKNDFRRAIQPLLGVPIENVPCTAGGWTQEIHSWEEIRSSESESDVEMSDVCERETSKIRPREPIEQGIIRRRVQEERCLGIEDMIRDECPIMVIDSLCSDNIGKYFRGSSS